MPPGNNTSRLHATLLSVHNCDATFSGAGRGGRRGTVHPQLLLGQNVVADHSVLGHPHQQEQQSHQEAGAVLAMRAVHHCRQVV